VVEASGTVGGVMASLLSIAFGGRRRLKINTKNVFICTLWLS
jgi:hypothetical protein